MAVAPFVGYNKVPRELIELISRQDAEIAMAPGEGMFSALDAAGKSRALRDLLIEAGAREL